MALKSSHPVVKVFFRGLGLLLPIALTIFLLAWLWNLLAETLVYKIDAGVEWLVAELVPAGQDPELILPPGLRLGVSIVAVVVLVILVGWWLGGFLGKRMFAGIERMLARVPVFGSIYPHIKQITEFFFGDEKDKKIEFAGVVAIPYPRDGLFSLALLTGSSVRAINQAGKGDCISVFVPSSPMPATGYTLFVPVNDIIKVDMTVDEALRAVMSGGVLIPEKEAVILSAPSAAERPPGLDGARDEAESADFESLPSSEPPSPDDA